MPDVMLPFAAVSDVSRPLTPGEKHIAYSIFGVALDVARVRIHNRAYFPLQGKGVAMTPNGDVWFRSDDYKADYSHDLLGSALLIHELTHAWQYQIGRSVRIRGLLEQFARVFGHDPYPYGIVDPSRDFLSYKNEQQAAMVEDYFRIRHGLKPLFGSGNLNDYERVIPFVSKR